MRVLFVSSLYHPHIGGIETMIAELADALKNRSIASVVLTKQWPKELPVDGELRGVPIYRVLSARTDEEFNIAIDWVRDNQEKIRADVIHVVGMRRPLPLIALLLSRLWKVPIICTITGGEIPAKNDAGPGAIWDEGSSFIPGVLMQADVVNCVSQALTVDLQKILPHRKDIATLYAGIDTLAIQKCSAEERGSDYIVSLRRLDPSKGVDVLIRAFAQIADNFPNLQLVIAGAGTERKTLEDLVMQLSVNRRTIFLGSVPLARGISLLKGAALTAVPSRSEGGGLVNVEAQAAGCPVVASRVDGIPEYVIDGRSGLLFEPGNAEDLAAKLKLLLTDKNLRDALIVEGLRHAEAFSWDALAPQYVDLYTKAIAEYDREKPFTAWSDLTTGLWKRINQQANG